ncbi:DUF3592 domain-containing protein [Algisphaera agarilytica]|uniref:DUF3592 domain-containing protein n=1 Tax=Algisphaera agarilytica TaxID=1385975 RepID=A0A7X0H6Y3_9BACT|nr:DUF3592 domain-containing protein [Algisphaera agarilytica]MBB6428964.1 hypothetical protein [Algisphaera agarilytica]
MKFSIGKGSGDLRERMQEKQRAKRKSPGVTKRAKGSKSGRVVGALFFSLFFFVGAGFGWFMFARPAIKLLDAQDWPSAPATVTSSDLESHSDSDGTTYKIKISFAYEYNGRRYTSDTYDFFSFMSSSGYRGKRDVVDDHPVGKQTTCYVNPKNPDVAVLHRGWSNNLWFGLIPLVFVLIGGGGMIAMLWGGSRGKSITQKATGTSRVGPRSEQEWLPAFARPDESDAVDGQIRSGKDTVTPTKSRWGGLLFVLLFMVIWDGVVAIALIKMLEDGVSANWGPLLFMIPFVLVGIGCLIAAVYMVLSLSNPVVRMRFDPRVIPLGSPLRVDWSIDGRAERFDRLTLTVEGLERASYTRGTDTITDEHVFFEHTLYDAEALDRRDPLAREGEAEMEFPANAMHSLDSDHNKIVWRIKVRGEIPRWPDVRDEYEFAVVPAGVTDGGPNVRGMF